LSKKKSLFYSASLLVFLCIGSLIAAQAGPARNLVVLFTHDMHSNLDEYAMPSADGNAVITGGYARLSTAIQLERKGKEGDTLVVDAGDFSMGTLFHTIRSTYALELVTMGLLGYDATTFGSRDFEFGLGPLANCLLSAKSNGKGGLPAIVASNTVVDSHAPELASFDKAYTGYPVVTYKIIKRAKLKIGVFGLMGKDASTCTPEAQPVKFSDPLDAARAMVDLLRNKEKVDMVVCLSHSGTWGDKNISEDEILAKAVPGIDVIVSGHTHTLLDSYIRVGNSYIVSSGCNSGHLGRLELTKNPDGSFKAVDYRIIPITSALPKDQEISRLVDSFKKVIDEEYLSYFNYHYGQPLAHSAFSLTYPDWSRGERSQCLTSGLGDLVTDAFIYAVKNKEGKDYRDISLAIEGWGQIRVPLAKGTLAVADAFRLMALGLGQDGLAGSPLVVFWLTGGEIKGLLELEATLAPDKEDMHLQISGMRFSFDPKAPPFARVKKVEVEKANGKFEPLKDTRLYRVCTNWKTLAMRDTLKALTNGKIVFIPKDEAGNPVADIKTTRVLFDAEKSLEMKEWLAVAMYWQSFPPGDKGLAEVPLKYSLPQANITKLLK
jgi:2',3'-cyclic-nucleotide 2'-phosphodiesterase (5'-nucleotidase family)